MPSTADLEAAYWRTLLGVTKGDLDSMRFAGFAALGASGRTTIDRERNLIGSRLGIAEPVLSRTSLSKLRRDYRLFVLGGTGLGKSTADLQAAFWGGSGYNALGPTQLATFKGSSLVGATQHTFNGITLTKAPDPNRVVFMIVGAPSEADIDNLNTKVNTVALSTGGYGGSATARRAGKGGLASVIWKTVPTGTTADIIIAFNLVVSNVNIMVFDVILPATFNFLQFASVETDNTQVVDNFAFSANNVGVAATYDATTAGTPTSTPYGQMDTNDVGGYRLGFAYKADDDNIPMVNTVDWSGATTVAMWSQLTAFYT